jgi:hypothetical protein
MNKIIILPVLGTLAALAALGGYGDYMAELESAVFYCDMIAAGHWPDYDNVASYCPDTYQQAAVYLTEFKRGF